MFAFHLKNAFIHYIDRKIHEATSMEYFDGHGMPQRYRLVIDVDTCVDRLYGGFEIDWKCGGEWGPMYKNLMDLKKCCNKYFLELVFIFNGTQPDYFKMDEWKSHQNRLRKNFFKIFNEPDCNETKYWTPPVGINDVLKYQINAFMCNETEPNHICTFSTLDNHQKNLKSYSLHPMPTIQLFGINL